MSICIKDQIQNMNIVIGCTVGCAYCYARNNVKRWHMIDDFAAPEFFPGKLKMMEKKRPQNFFLTGMSDLSGWKPEWRDEVFEKIRENPQHQFLFLTKRPDLLDFDTDLENAWFGVTVTRKAERWRTDALRNNVKRWHMIDDFADPEFFSGKLKMMEKKRPQNFLLTGMSDLSGWKPEWRDEVLAKIRENPQHQFLFLTKRPDLLDFDTDLKNAWFGVTVTRKVERWRIDALRKNVRAKHYHVTFEPLFDDPGTVDLSGINWIVVGTMTGAQSRKIHTEPEWAWSLTDQAHKLGIPVFMKEDLVPIIGDENMIQEMPEEFNKVLEVQKSWKK